MCAAGPVAANWATTRQPPRCSPPGGPPSPHRRRAHGRGRPRGPAPGMARLRGWLEEDREGRRLHRQLTEAANQWVAHRDPEQLYRGARLAAALDWASGHDPDLNDSERAFWLPAPSSTSVSCAGLAALRPSWPVCLWSCWSPGRWRWCSARPPGATRSSPPQGPGCPGDRPHGQPVRPGVPAGGGGVPIPELGRNARRPADCPGPERTAHRLQAGLRQRPVRLRTGPDGSTVAAGSRDGTLRFGDLGAGTPRTARSRPMAACSA